MFDIDKLDKEFISKAQKQFVFNIASQDFNSTKYKKEIQYLINTNIFPKFDMTSTIKGVPRSADQINSLIKKLKGFGGEAFDRVYKYPMVGVGPGEIMLYFLLDDCKLGGGSSAGVDVSIGSKNYEVKSVQNPAKENYSYVSGFKIGGTSDVADIVAAAMEIKKKALEDRIIPPNAEKSGISKPQIEALKKNSVLKKQWSEKVEGPYQKIAGKYLSANPVIFMINTTPKPRLGEVVFLGNIKPENVFLEVVTQGVIKPEVKIK